MTNTHTVTFTTRDGGTYHATAHPDGTTTLVGCSSSGYGLNLTGTVAGAVIHPGHADLGPMFYLGDEHGRLIRTGALTAVLVDGVPVTPVTFHEMTSIDHLGVHVGSGFLSSAENSPVVTHQETAYLPEIVADLFGPTGPLFAEIV